MSAAATANRPALGKPSISLVVASAWPALLLATLCLLPFLSKPFLVDDPHFLEMARQIVRHPLHPMDFTICWNTADDCAKAYLLTASNALMGYALVPTVLTGTREWVAHFTQIVFVWIAILSMTSLASRFGWDRAQATAARCPWAPSPFADGQLRDAVYTRGARFRSSGNRASRVESGTEGGPGGRRPRLPRASGICALSLGPPFAARGVFPVGQHGAKADRLQIRQRFWLWTPILAGAVLLGSIILITRERTTGMAYPVTFSGTGNIAPNLRAYLLYFAFPLPLAACWLANRWQIGWRRRVIVTLAIAILLPCIHPNHGLPLFFTIVGFGVLVDLVLEALRTRDQEAVFLLLWLMIPIPIAYYGHLPMKYLLPCIPALILLCLRLSEGFSPRVLVLRQTSHRDARRFRNPTPMPSFCGRPPPGH